MLLLAALVVCGMGVYLSRYLENGENWAMYFFRANSGTTGHIVDRNGITLAYFDETRNVYSPDRITRSANYHIIGDYWGRTGTGILSRIWENPEGFSLLTGTTHAGSRKQLTLTYDARLNDKIFETIGDWSTGCMAVCNYRTGELLGMVSMPGVDPLDNSAEQKDGAFINRCISAAYTPGSIFKLITAAAAIERIPDIDKRQWYCEEEFLIAGVPFHCVADHYTQNFTQALANSCNIAFAQIAVSLGQNTMIEYVRKYGFLDGHSIDGIPTAKGSYPLEFVGDPETGWSGIGQSTDLVVPYSMLRFLCAVANGGTLIEPHFFPDEKLQTTQLVKPATAERLKALMKNNVVSHYNPESNFPGLSLCAKTGTAELGGDEQDHSWFVGFLDDEEHPYAFVTLIEHGGFGLTRAGRITNEVLQWAVKNM